MALQGFGLSIPLNLTPSDTMAGIWAIQIEYCMFVELNSLQVRNCM
ncbi:hypothetical protein DOT_5768 [Desulfosporosinus sp. OT]|nr:hypothetical protein DOT_5768 [Desulfosporosinus sp. OT]